MISNLSGKHLVILAKTPTNTCTSKDWLIHRLSFNKLSLSRQWIQTVSHTGSSVLAKLCIGNKIQVWDALFLQRTDKCVMLLLSLYLCHLIPNYTVSHTNCYLHARKRAVMLDVIVLVPLTFSWGCVQGWDVLRRWTFNKRQHYEAQNLTRIELRWSTVKPALKTTYIKRLPFKIPKSTFFTVIHLC